MSAPRLFDDAALLARRRRAARLARPDFLTRRLAEDLADRVLITTRQFERAADIASPDGRLSAALTATGRVQFLVRTEPVADLVRPGAGPVLACPAELIPFADASLDLVASSLALQSVNDLPGLLAQIRRALKPDGLLLAAMLGGDSLSELRQVFAAAEIETLGGVSPRVSPFADIRDIGALLQRAGFALPVADSDTITVRYSSIFALFEDLRGMGLTNALAERSRRPLRRETLARLAALYHERFGDPDGKVRATFEVIHLSGWAPHQSQQKPLKPGSARMCLADALGVAEQPLKKRPD